MANLNVHVDEIPSFRRKHSVQDSQDAASRKSSANEKTFTSPRKSSSSSSAHQLDSLCFIRSPLGFDSLSPRKGSLVLDSASPRRSAASSPPASRFTCSPVHGEEEGGSGGGLRKASIIKDPTSRKSSGLDSRRSSNSQVKKGECQENVVFKK
jgi:hypothetical protein